MTSDAKFRTDLYRGAALDYEQFRVSYPQSLIADLLERTAPAPSGRMLDLACGTGQVGFAMRGRFEQIWAVDQEQDMIAVVRTKAQAAGAADILPFVAAAESASFPPQSFDLVTIGNAFHRLRRDAVAANVLRWLRPGGHLALVWGGGPFYGDEPWQHALRALMQRWQRRAQERNGTGPAIPAGYEQARAAEPDQEVLREAGFEPQGSWHFLAEHSWTLDALVGNLFSTSGLTRHALGSLAREFEHDVRAQMGAYASDGRIGQMIDFGYDLARLPDQ
jgi:ubiquinone/menaquinone biosynthesis C-methylase UbiE